MSEPLNNALNNLNTTVQSITNKVNQQKEMVKGYKKNLVVKLSEVVSQIIKLKETPSLASISQLQQQLKQIPQLQQELANKTNLLEQTNKNLETSNQRIQELQRNIEQITNDINSKKEEIDKLKQDNTNKEQQINELNTQIQGLNKQKMTIENELNATKQQTNDLVKRIGEINAYLASQIETISRIASELGDLNDKEIVQQFELITSNIQGIINMINTTKTGGSDNYNIEENIKNLHDLRNDPSGQYLQFTKSLNGQIKRMIDDNISKFDNNDETEIRKILQQYNIMVPKFRTSGGKRKIKTKKRNRKSYKKMNKYRMNGGYVYTSSKELDNSSSIISGSYGTSSKKKYRKHMDKTRRKQ